MKATIRNIIMKHWKDVIIPVLLLVLNFLVKLWFIDSRDLAMDEPFTVFHAQADLLSIFRMLPGENNPPLYFILMHFWVGIAGISAFAVRLPALIFSVATAWMLYETGRRFFTWSAGLTGSLLFTFSNYHMLFAHEARVYALFSLLAALSMYLFLALSEHPRRKSLVALLVTVNLLLIYAHFFGFFIVAIQVLSVISIPAFRKTILRQTMVVAGLTFLGFLPYAGIAFQRFSGSSGGTWVPAPVISDLYTMIWRYCNAPVVTVVFLAILAAAGVKYLFTFRKPGPTDPRKLLILVWFFVPYLFMFGISFRLPVFFDRYTVFISLAFYLLTGLALDFLIGNTRFRVPVVLAAALLMLFTFTPDVDNKRRMKELVNLADSLGSERSVVILCPQWLQYGYVYHAAPEIFADYTHFETRIREAGIIPANSLTDLDTSMVGRSTDVVFVGEWEALVDPDENIRKYLAARFPDSRSWKVYQSFSLTHFRK